MRKLLMYVRFSGLCKPVFSIKKVCICINIYFIYYFPPPSYFDWSNWLTKTLLNNTHICFQIFGVSATFQKIEIYFKGAELTFITGLWFKIFISITPWFMQANFFSIYASTAAWIYWIYWKKLAYIGFFSKI